MKKLMATLLTASLAMGMLAGCSKPVDAPPKEETPAAGTEAPGAELPEGEAVDLLFSTHEVGTSNYTISAGIGTMWQDYLPEGSAIDVQPTSPGGMGAPYLFETGQADIAFINGAPAKWAYEEGTLGKFAVTS